MLTRQYIRDLIREEIAGKTTFHLREVVDEPLLGRFDSINEAFETVNDHTLIKETEKSIQEIKSMTQEIRRMKQVVDFREPLLPT